ncbi:MAG: hypothetical protein ABI654_10440 [Betaproteobacteria bacterium]
MNRSIWAVSYGIDAARVDAYIDWFHGVHIPEKLARPGYAWAAHYRSLKGERHLAFFGAADAGVFLSPTPGQLKSRQDALTREMVGLRAGAATSIFAEVTRTPSRDKAGCARGMEPAPFLRFMHYDVQGGGAEDAAAAWVVQHRFERIGACPGAMRARLLLAVLGTGKYALFEEFASEEALRNAPAAFPEGAVHAAGSPFEGGRIWPRRHVETE